MNDDKLGCLDALLDLLFGPRKPREWPYHRKKYLLTYAENSFYRVLLKVFGDKTIVQCKVRLADLFYIHSKDKDYISYLNRVTSKHVDFVLCKPGSLEVIMAIELDDKSHQNEKVKKRDQFKDEAFAAAKLPLLRVQAKKRYDPVEIRELIIQAVKGEEDGQEKVKEVEKERDEEDPGFDSAGVGEGQEEV